MTPEALAFIGAVDLCGLLRGKSIPLAALERRIGRGVGMAPLLLLSSPFGPGQERTNGGLGDLVLVPDPATRAQIPVLDSPDITLLLGDLLEVDGSPWECCPRYFLRRGLAALHAEFGLTLLAGFEQGLVYSGAGGRAGAPYSLEALRRQGGFGGKLLAAMRANGLTPDKFQALAGAGQYQVASSAVPGVSAADQAAVLRELTRAVAATLGHRAILAPALSPDRTGNAAPIHWSLRDERGRPASHDEAGVLGLSIEAEHMAAGMLHHLPAVMAVTAPSPASYFGLDKPLTELGAGDRGAPLRLCPVYAISEEPASAQVNIEVRVSDATANPYLALGALLWAGIDGLRRRRRLADVKRVPAPGSLAIAVEAFEESVAVAEWFGPVLREAYLRVKREELDAVAGLDPANICARYAGVY